MTNEEEEKSSLTQAEKSFLLESLHLDKKRFFIAHLINQKILQSALFYASIQKPQELINYLNNLINYKKKFTLEFSQKYQYKIIKNLNILHQITNYLEVTFLQDLHKEITNNTFDGTRESNDKFAAIFNQNIPSLNSLAFITQTTDFLIKNRSNFFQQYSD